MRLGKAMAARGFTLIELMIGLVIFALLALLAAPMYGDFMANTQVRTAADSVLEGVRLAQTEAVRRNVPVRFELLGSTVLGSTAWQVDFLSDDNLKRTCGAVVDTSVCTSDSHIAVDCPPGSTCVVRAYNFATGAPNALAKTPDGNSEVTFSSLGVVTANTDTSNPLTRINITNGVLTSARPLSVIVGSLASPAAGGTKLCDPALASTDIMGCP